MPQCYLCGATIAHGRGYVRSVDTDGGLDRRLICRACAKTVGFAWESVAKILLFAVAVVAVIALCVSVVLHELATNY